jgi:glycolate oxidase iron-sulfur subunit
MRIERDLIDQCVHCGFCLPSCPTYELWGDEMDSPRGRIVLMSELEQGADPSEELTRHLDNCLGCLSCVSACPSGVRYDLLIQDTRLELGISKPRKALLTAATQAGRLALRQLPKVTPAVGETRGRVGFLQGCVQRLQFGRVNRATAAVLAAEGFEVHAPREPACCGSLMQHVGDDRALDRARETIRAFAPFDVVVTNVAGCGSGMKDYGHLLREDPVWAKEAERFARKVRDVHELLASVEPRAERGPVPMRVAYHDACHLAHGQAVRAQPRDLLRAIPGLELLEPPEGEICCGSAGIYNLVKPKPAWQLGRRKASALATTGAEAIAAANPGCQLQIGFHSDLPVLHPMELLHRSLCS